MLERLRAGTITEYWRCSESGGVSLECVETSRHGEGMRAAAQAAVSERFDAVVAAGGDGTIHDVAAGLLGTPVPLGIIPMGTANVFAREVGLPRSPQQVANTLMDGKVGIIPVGQINGQPVLFVVGIGFDAEAVRRFETAGTRKLGQAGFIGPIAHALFSEGNRHVAVVSGLRPDNLSRMVEELRDPVNPRNEHLLYRQLSAFTIETGKPLHVNLDGEPIKGTRFEFRCCPEALSVVRGGAAATQ